MTAVATARCPVLIGRGPETVILASAVGRLAEGAGSVTLLTGEAGIGKTRLAEHAAELARRAGTASRCFQLAGAGSGSRPSCAAKVIWS
jgi:MoxR-like ATPase